MDAYIIVGCMPEAFNISERPVKAIKKPTLIIRPERYSSSPILSTKVLANEFPTKGEDQFRSDFVDFHWKRRMPLGRLSTEQELRGR
jgi:hypothetical protein